METFFRIFITTKEISIDVASKTTKFIAMVTKLPEIHTNGFEILEKFCHTNGSFSQSPGSHRVTFTVKYLPPSPTPDVFLTTPVTSFKLKGKSASTTLKGTICTYFVYTVPIKTRATFFRLKGKSTSTAVTESMYTHFVYTVPFTTRVTFLQFKQNLHLLP